MICLVIFFKSTDFQAVMNGTAVTVINEHVTQAHRTSVLRGCDTPDRPFKQSESQEFGIASGLIKHCKTFKTVKCF